MRTISCGCQRRTPIHTENFHSGGATTLSFIGNGANIVTYIVMRSETSGNMFCAACQHGKGVRLLANTHVTRHWQAHPRQHHDRRGRKHSAEGENTFQCFVHGTVFIVYFAEHSAGERESSFPLQFQREEYGIPPCYPRVLQCIRECMRTNILSKRAVEDNSHTSDDTNSVAHNVSDASRNALVLLLQMVLAQNWTAVVSVKKNQLSFGRNEQWMNTPTRFQR